MLKGLFYAKNSLYCLMPCADALMLAARTRRRKERAGSLADHSSPPLIRLYHAAVRKNIEHVKRYDWPLLIAR